MTNAEIKGYLSALTDISVNLEEEKQPVTALHVVGQMPPDTEVIDLDADGFIYARLNDLVQEKVVSVSFAGAMKETMCPCAEE